MAQIFVSHSAKDAELVGLLSRAFAATKVRGVFEEFDAIRKGPANASRIIQDIRQSNAIFTLLGRNVESLPHTRDWVNFEGGAAAGASPQPVKDHWVIESLQDLGVISVVVPRLQHYICLDPRAEVWQGYLTQIISSYDDSHVLPTAATCGLTVAAATENIVAGFVGGMAALMLAAMATQSRPAGVSIRCLQCTSVYNVHLASQRMRCPVCNMQLALTAK